MNVRPGRVDVEMDKLLALAGVPNGKSGLLLCLAQCRLPRGFARF